MAVPVVIGELSLSISSIAFSVSRKDLPKRPYLLGILFTSPMAIKQMLTAKSDGKRFGDSLQVNDWQVAGGRWQLGL